MNVAVLGTGIVGQELAGKLQELGHEVAVGTRDPDESKARTEPDPRGFPSFGQWFAEHPKVAVATFSDAAAHGEVIFNATNGAVSLDALKAAGAANMSGKVLIDAANPLDFSRGFPPTLIVKDTDSLGEQIQRAYPDVKVVKALNTVNAHVMVDPGSVGGDHTIFLCGNDDGAKAVVTTILTGWFGWADALDLGDITAARGMEMYLPLWLRLMGAIGPMFNVKVVRAAT